jgi:hypothetical protein
VGSGTPEATGFAAVGDAEPSGTTSAATGNEAGIPGRHSCIGALRRGAPLIPVVQPTDAWQSEDLGFSFWA